MKQGIVNIRGKNYRTVASRVNEFREDYEHDLALLTELVSNIDNVVIVKATITDKDGFVIATGYAEEIRGSSNINKTSALENCETSAIGRALANFGLAGEEYASANEVEQAIHQQDNPKQQPKKLTPIDEAKKALFAAAGNDLDALNAASVKAYGKEASALTIGEMQTLTIELEGIE